MKTLLRAIPLLLLVVTLAACSNSGQTPEAKASGPASATSAPPPPAPPQVGQLPRAHPRPGDRPGRLRRPVPCRRSHTAMTFKVGKLAALADGHLLAVDSPAVQAAAGEDVPDGAPGYVGGDQTTQRLSRFEAVWFAPSVDAGRRRRRLVPLRRRRRCARGPADRAAAHDEGRRSTPPARSTASAPAARPRPTPRASSGSSARAQHSWRAVDAIDLPRRPATSRRTPRPRRRRLQGRRLRPCQRRAEVHLELRVADPGAVGGRPALRVLLGAEAG